MHQLQVIAVTIALAAGIAILAVVPDRGATKGSIAPHAVHHVASYHIGQSLPVEAINDMTFVEPSAN